MVAASGFAWSMATDKRGRATVTGYTWVREAGDWSFSACASSNVGYISRGGPGPETSVLPEELAPDSA